MAYSILIIKLGAIGDVLRTTSILSGLRKKYGDISVDWVTKKSAYPLLKYNKLIDYVFVFEDLKDTLIEKKFDLVINIDEEEEACKIASEVSSDKVIGAYFQNGKPVYTDDSAPWFDMGLISKFGKEKADELKKQNTKTYQQILSEILDIEVGEPILELNEETLAFAKKFAQDNGIKKGDKLIGLNTGAGMRWQLKKLSIDQTADLINRLSEELNAKILLFGGPEELDRNMAVLDKAGDKVIDAGCKNSLLDFASLVNLCDVVVTSDTLAMNISIALKKKTVVFFGPTSAAEIELYGRGKKIVPEMDCVCCYRKTCNKTPSCMDKIDIEDIVKAVKDRIK